MREGSPGGAALWGLRPRPLPAPSPHTPPPPPSARTGSAEPAAGVGEQQPQLRAGAGRGEEKGEREGGRAAAAAGKKRKKKKRRERGREGAGREGPDLLSGDTERRYVCVCVRVCEGSGRAEGGLPRRPRSLSPSPRAAASRRSRAARRKTTAPLPPPAPSRLGPAPPRRLPLAAGGERYSARGPAPLPLFRGARPLLPDPGRGGAKGAGRSLFSAPGPRHTGLGSHSALRNGSARGCCARRGRSDPSRPDPATAAVTAELGASRSPSPSRTERLTDGRTGRATPLSPPPPLGSGTQSPPPPQPHWLLRRKY